MYFFVGFLLFLGLCLCGFPYFKSRRKKACKKLCAMTCEEKLSTLDGLIKPFGYCYVPSQDVFSTVVDAPQRAFGYTALYDRYAPYFGMVIDCLPVYFDYGERTWMVELWKGQYGINLGCEVGIYKADSLVASINRKKTLFKSVDDSEMLPMSVRLYQGETECAHLHRKQWWLTAFRMGCYSTPGALSVRACITFPNRDMMSAFVNALSEQTDAGFNICGTQVQIFFKHGVSSTLSFWRKLVCRFALWKNRLSCRLFLWATKPFESSMDRLLCLYFCLPSFFRRIFRDKKRRKCCKKSCCRCSVRRISNCLRQFTLMP